MGHEDAFPGSRAERPPASFRLKTRAIDDFTSKSLALMRTPDRRGEALVVASRRPDRHRARRFGPTPTRQAGCQAAPAQAVERKRLPHLSGSRRARSTISRRKASRSFVLKIAGV